ncbi:MAG: WD40 repeat domain-containing protein [Rikenellaceae bacterium]
MNLKHTLILAILLLCASNVKAQDSLSMNKKHVITTKHSPEKSAYYSYAIYYAFEGRVYNSKGFTINAFYGDIDTISMNPAGRSCAVIYTIRSKKCLEIVGVLDQKNVIHEFKNKEKKLYCAMTYSPDAKTFAVANKDYEIEFYNTRDYTLEKSIVFDGFECELMKISSNNYFLVASSGKEMKIYNIDGNTMRKEITFDGNINDFEFSADDNTLAVLTDDGILTTYDTKTFVMLQRYENMGIALRCKFHPDGKYMFVVDDTDRIMAINLINSEQRSYYNSDYSSIKSIDFISGNTGGEILLYNNDYQYVFQETGNLTPFFGKLLKDELNDKMDTWLKKMDDETLDQYNERVNDDNRMDQIKLYENEIATRMAGDLVERSEVKTGEYNLGSNVLELDFNTMPPIYLELPVEDVEDFMDTGNLEFRNAMYGVTEDDGFELIYADVYNAKTNKTYVYDNLERKPLTMLKDDSEFVSIELIQQSQMDEIVLEQIKEEVMESAKNENIISDHTNIQVSTKMVAATDANGNNITNYQIDYEYNVDAEYSAMEDFKPGKFKTDESHAAIAMMDIVKKSLETTFAKYIQEGKKVQIKISGNADALPINGMIRYDGVYGEFKDEPVYKNGQISAITVNKSQGIRENEQLAFLRAYGVKVLLEKSAPEITVMDCDYNYYIEVLKEEGGEFRRIKLELIFVDAI